MTDRASLAQRLADQAKHLQHELELWDHSRSDDCRARALSVALSLASSLETITAALSKPTDQADFSHPHLGPVPGPRWRD